MERFLPTFRELDIEGCHVNDLHKRLVDKLSQLIRVQPRDVHFVFGINMPDGSIESYDISTTDLLAFEQVTTADIGSEFLRFGALSRIIAKICQSKHAAVATNHPRFQSCSMKSNFIVIESFAHFNNTLTSYFYPDVSHRPEVQQRLIYNANPEKLAQLCKREGKDELHFAGFLNIYDDTLFTGSSLSMQFSLASYNHAYSLAKRRQNTVGC